jgi:hypothetical protein
MADLKTQVKQAAQAVGELTRKLPAFSPGDGPLVIVTTRQNGFALSRAWAAGAPGDGNLREAFAELARSFTGKAAPDAMQIELGHSARKTPPASMVPRLGSTHTGMRGIGLIKGNKLLGVMGPAEMIATNTPMREALETLLTQNGLTQADISSGAAEVTTYDVAQVLVTFSDPPKLTPLYRGQPLVQPAEVNRQGVTAFADRLSTWMVNQVDGAGKLTYEFAPATGETSENDNTVRQALATLCLGRIANRSKKQADRDVADRNLGHFMRHHYRLEGELGVISEIDQAKLPLAKPGDPVPPVPDGQEPKLGSIALIALALIERPTHTPFEKPLAALIATTRHLQKKNGAFRTRFGDTKRDDNQNFYPGETLLLWASLLQRKSKLMDVATYMKSAKYYRKFYKATPSPAFIPWHTQAHVLALETIKEPKDAKDLTKFVFEMNDWLVDLQQWDGAPYVDMAGRFYDPKRKNLGSAHASATGVYLEGLVDAYELARRSNDAKRADRYRLTILRGLRNLMQLQFRSPEDMFYVTDKDRVFGGIRTEVYDSRIRVDNVQHALMATQRILARFSEPSFKWPQPAGTKTVPGATKKPVLKDWQVEALKNKAPK